MEGLILQKGGGASDQKSHSLLEGERALCLLAYWTMLVFKAIGSK